MRSVLVIVGASAIVGAQAGQSEPTFEAASIKVVTGSFMTSPGAATVGFPPGGRFTMKDGAAIVLLRSAYPDAVDIVGVPDWANGAVRYDVEAKGAENATYDQLHAMLRSMLVERFHLAAHRETHNLPTYNLMVARDDGRLGPDLRKYPGDCKGLADAARAGRPRPELPPPSNGASACGMMFTGQRILAGGIPMANLAANLTSLAGRTVIDRTNLDGYYELTLTRSPDVAVFTAVREQLGLKLEPGTAPLPVLIVDHMERPTPN
jgi:uncharacterized protein (TIGR03435 family)